MQFVDFEGTNFAFTKPENTTDDQCGTLRVQRGLVEIEGQDFPVNTSGWKPSPEDLERLNNGGLIFLNIFGAGHPMVSVGTEKLPIKPLP